MSCLFESVAAALGPPATSATLRALVCDALERGSYAASGTPLAEWGAMETGLSSDAYVTRMRDARTWGGGVELATLARLLHAPICVRAPDATYVFGKRYARIRPPIELRYAHAHYTAAAAPPPPPKRREE
jgi:hypothetical protein